MYNVSIFRETVFLAAKSSIQLNLALVLSLEERIIFMNSTNSRIFNPEILYAFDPWNEIATDYNPHHHDFLEISILLEGTANYEIQQQKFTLTEPTIMLFNPYVEHGESQLPGTFSHQLHIGLRNVSLDGLKRNFFPNKSAILQLGDLQSLFMDKAWQIVTEINQQLPEHQLIVKALTIELLALILRNLQTHQENKLMTSLNSTGKRKQNIVNHTIYYLENHHEQEITLEQLADILYVSPTYLSKTFKEATGISPINYLIQIRLNHARELLLENEHLTVKEIAKQVGYEDAYHFSKLFKKYYGKAPSMIKE